MTITRAFTLNELARALLAEVARANLGFSQARLRALAEFKNPRAQAELTSSFFGPGLHQPEVGSILGDQFARALNIEITDLSLRLALEPVPLSIWQKLWRCLFSRKSRDSLYRFASGSAPNAIRCEVKIGPAMARGLSASLEGVGS